jgi:N-acetylmuramoyl-L-alanine amidase
MNPQEQIAAASELDLLIAVIRGEAESEPFIGKLAVACVIRNRVHDSRWPGNYRDVILQRKQFSCFMDGFFRPGIFRHEETKLWWRECRFAAYGILHDCVGDITEGANLYWNPSIIEKPPWDWSKVVILEKIGKHQMARE